MEVLSTRLVAGETVIHVHAQVHPGGRLRRRHPGSRGRLLPAPQAPAVPPTRAPRAPAPPRSPPEPPAHVQRDLPLRSPLPPAAAAVLAGDLRHRLHDLRSGGVRQRQHRRRHRQRPSQCAVRRHSTADGDGRHHRHFRHHRLRRQRRSSRRRLRHQRAVLLAAYQEGALPVRTLRRLAAGLRHWLLWPPPSAS